MRIYCIYFDRIQKETDLGKMFLFFDFDTGTVLQLPKERAREFIKDRTGKETEYCVWTFQCCGVIILYHLPMSYYKKEVAEYQRRRCLGTQAKVLSYNEFYGR